MCRQELLREQAQKKLYWQSRLCKSCPSSGRIQLLSTLERNGCSR